MKKVFLNNVASYLELSFYGGGSIYPYCFSRGGEEKTPFKRGFFYVINKVPLSRDLIYYQSQL